MKQYLFAAACLLAIFYTGCTCNSSSNKTGETDSVQTARNIIAEDSAMLFDDTAQAFILRALQLQSLPWNRFTLEEFWAEDSIQKKPFTADTGFYNKYAGVLRWSPDSSYVLDIGSYGSVVLKDKKGNNHIVAGDPDTEVALLYPKEQQKWRLLFGGPSTHIFNAVWPDSTEVAMLGVLDREGTSNDDTLLWLIDVKGNFFRRYKWH
ncbi:hypothetical protein [Deminuibacter soli]|uniref:Uncharacterized protein n=1 Tax=Deminuibacter soli TaxID=2291815 RepID=A0A3E1NQQ3_9BACT|nr:hypothetical protein [Deminuibacter soli]RFM30289.1 hypothetical protein DXN05_04810 [Deminuibacter soli]